MWGSRYFTARYWTSRFFTATGSDVVPPGDLFGEAILSLIDGDGNGVLSPILQIGLSSVISDAATGLLSSINSDKTGIESAIQ